MNCFTSIQKSKQKGEVVTTPGVEKVKQGCEVDDQTEEKVNHSGAGTDQEPGHLCQYRQNEAQVSFDKSQPWNWIIGLITLGFCTLINGVTNRYGAY